MHLVEALINSKNIQIITKKKNIALDRKYYYKEL